METTQVLIVGAGPIGLELAIALRRASIDYVQLDAGQVGQTMTWYPRQARFFSSPERIALAGIPLHTADQNKATREEYLAYLRSLVEMENLRVRTFERVVEICPGGAGTGAAGDPDAPFIVRSTRGIEPVEYLAQNVVLAIGDMHRPRLLHIPGEELAHVSHFFDEPHTYFRRDLLIVGGGNSAVEAAIRCHRAGARVAMSYRRDAFDDRTIKYWLLPEIRWLIQTGRVTFYPSTVPRRIAAETVTLGHVGGRETRDVRAEAVLLLTGYEMDTTLLERAGVKLVGANRAPMLHPQTMETNVPRLFVIGTAAAGSQMEFRLFIENCHVHVDRVVAALTGREAPTPPPYGAGESRLPES